jgi:transposase
MAARRGRVSSKLPHPTSPGQIQSAVDSRNLFCFVNKRRNQIKVLYWQRTGFCLWLKRLEEERFKWPFHLEGPVVELDEEQFRWLLDGLDLKHLKPHRSLEYRTVL